MKKKKTEIDDIELPPIPQWYLDALLKERLDQIIKERQERFDALIKKVLNISVWVFFGLEALVFLLLLW